jgi:hypothetical protein
MKRLTLLLLVLLAWQMASAHVVTADQARQRAARFFTEAEVRTKSASVSPDEFKLVGTFPEITTKSPATDPAMYIFERAAGGYAIVSGDDVARPVLGYSLEGRFPISDMPDNMRALLQWYADIIAYAREQGWESFSDEETDSGLDPANSVQLQTARWSQGHPFNDLVPEINGQKPPIGCVATATAIIMKYHKWPKRGTGSLPSYDYEWNGNKYHIQGFSLGHEYDWELMPDDCQNCSDDEAAQISRLLYDVAVMCNMLFTPGLSVGRTPMLLPEYFDYDKQLRAYARGLDFYSDNDWERFILNELDAGRPVYYEGDSMVDGQLVAGHAFVIDGYYGRYFSINFGWAGSYNDFYTVTPIEGHEDELLSFYYHQYMVCGIMPDKGNAPKANLSSTSIVFLIPPFKLEEFSLSQVVSNGAFGNPPSIDISFVLYDCHGNFKEKVSVVDDVGIISGGYHIRSSCRISRPIEEGDMIVLSDKDPESGAWRQIPEIRASRIVFTARPLSDMVEIGYEENPKSDLPGNKGDIFFKLYKDISWELFGETRNGYGVVLNSGGYFPDMSGHYYYYMLDNEYDNPQCETIVYELGLPSGTYRLRMRNPMTGEEMEIVLEV